ncbi:MAG: nucleoside triphosphate pyrophosphohydrolase [Crocinitomicaceae bacterium]|nr:nucleoside triphosphate pyrophosphohydrolase [Crocinitomicaceae bacterium]MDG1659416.1 nucleoside triphosphate pyrophosphohydrolase [Crocinitomicaceae bacterium]|tara:strand:+ start:307 stop:1083 length:777 start_codon:yes stop_codon:yes gene_type:complete
MDSRLVAFERLLNIMDDLREKCPWDQKQTLESLRHLTIEETYELADAITANDMNELKGEIGDLFLHMVFYCKIGEEKNAFNVTEVLNSICDKLVHRHPHVYGDTEVESEEEVKRNWEKLKLKEGRKSVLGGVPNSLPALVKAYRVQEKVKGIGFEWEKRSDVWAKVEEEMNELQEEVESNAPIAKIEDEFGDVLFSLINYARFIGVNPEDALSRTNQKFIKRFTSMETLMDKDNLSLAESDLELMDKYWEIAKRSENG